MKFYLLSLTIIVSLFSFTYGSESLEHSKIISAVEYTSHLMSEALVDLKVGDSHLMSEALINWKVGDSQEFRVKLGIGLEGTMEKEAVREEGNAIWIRQKLTLPIANDTSEILIDRNNGKVLKYVRNGKEEPIPDSDIEVIKTMNDTVEVPAGKFKCLHIWAKSKQVSHIEIWSNPREIALDGAAKIFVKPDIMDVTMELTKFRRQ